MTSEELYERGKKLLKENDYTSALAAFDKVVELKPDFAPAWFGKGVALGKLGLQEEELKAYDKLIELKPDDEKVWYIKGVTLGLHGQYEEALKAFNKVIELKPDDAEALYFKGITLWELGQYEEALKAYDKVIGLKPDDEKAWFNKGVALGKLGQQEEALKAFEKVIELKPDDAKAYFNLGFSYFAKGKYNLASFSFKKAGDLFSYYDEIDKKEKALGFRFFSKGMHDWQKKQNDKAISNFKKAIKHFIKSGLEDAANSLISLSKIIPLDEMFLSALAAKSLATTKKKIRLVEKYIIKSKKFILALPKDIEDIVWAKIVCFSALIDALENKDVKNEELAKARSIFEQYKFDSSIIAVNNLQNFIYELREVKKLHKIPKNKERRLLKALNPISTLDGVLTEEIPRRLKKEPYPARIIEKKFPELKIFIGYEETAGLHFANHLKDALVKMDMDAFVAKKGIRSISEWKKIIDANIRNCDYFIVIITISAIKSKEVKREVKIAKKWNKKRIVCKSDELEREMIERYFPSLAPLQHIDFTEKGDLAHRVIGELLKIELEKKEIKKPKHKLKKI